jgi:hypothetical protein
VNTAEVARPLASVVAVFVPPANVPLAPFAGAVNVTVAPLTAAPSFVTFATSGAAKAVLTVVFCGVPLFAAMVSTGGGGAECELLQPVQKTKARKIKARRLA